MRLIYLVIFMALPLQAFSEGLEWKTIENTKYQWSVKIPKCWKLSWGEEKEIRTNYRMGFTSEKCSKDDSVDFSAHFEVKPASKSPKEMLTEKTSRLMYRRVNLDNGGTAIMFANVSPHNSEVEGKTMKAVGWQIHIPCDKDYIMMIFSHLVPAENVQLKWPKREIKGHLLPPMLDIIKSFQWKKDCSSPSKEK